MNLRGHMPVRIHYVDLLANGNSSIAHESRTSYMYLSKMQSPPLYRWPLSANVMKWPITMLLVDVDILKH